MGSKIPVKDLDDLRARVRSGVTEYAIALNGGAYSRKTIRLKGRIWRVKNHIDGTRQELSDAELWTESNIGKAIDFSALWEF